MALFVQAARDEFSRRSKDIANVTAFLVRPMEAGSRAKHWAPTAAWREKLATFLFTLLRLIAALELVDRVTPINDHSSSCHKGGIVRNEEQRRPGNFFRACHAFKGM